MPSHVPIPYYSLEGMELKGHAGVLDRMDTKIWFDGLFFFIKKP